MRKEELCEVLGDISEKHIAEAGADRKAGKPAWLKWSAAAACLCLVVLGAFAVRRLGTPGTGIEPPEASQLVINEVEQTAALDMDVRISHCSALSSTEWESVMKAFESAVGFSYAEFLEKLPAGRRDTAFYSVDVPVSPKSAVYRPHDYVFEFQTESGGSVKIAICAAEEPIRDCFFVCDDPKESEINGTAAVIYGIQDSFWVQFAYAGVNYDMETCGISLKELEDLLTCMICR